MSLESEKLREVLLWFENSSVPYALVGEDTHRLCHEILSDVDIVVSKATIDQIHRVLDEMSVAIGLIRIQLMQHGERAFYFVFAWQVDLKWHYLKLDICDDYRRYARLLMTEQELLSGRHKDPSSGFFVPSNDANFLYYLVKKIDKRELSQAQFDYLRTYYVRCSPSIDNELCRFFDQARVDRIKTFFRTKDLDGFRDSLLDMQKSLRKHCRMTSTSLLNEFKRLVYRVSLPTGMVVVVKGPHSVVNDQVADAISHCYPLAYRRHDILAMKSLNDLFSICRKAIVANIRGGLLIISSHRNELSCFLSVMTDIKYEADYVASNVSIETEIICVLACRQKKRYNLRYNIA